MYVPRYGSLPDGKSEQMSYQQLLQPYYHQQDMSSSSASHQQQQQHPPPAPPPPGPPPLLAPPIQTHTNNNLTLLPLPYTNSKYQQPSPPSACSCWNCSANQYWLQSSSEFELSRNSYLTANSHSHLHHHQQQPQSQHEQGTLVQLATQQQQHEQQQHLPPILSSTQPIDSLMYTTTVETTAASAGGGGSGGGGATAASALGGGSIIGMDQNIYNTPNQTPNSKRTKARSRNRTRKRTSVDWNEFYKNGYPEEVIVISSENDDDDDDNYDDEDREHSKKRLQFSSSSDVYTTVTENDLSLEPSRKRQKRTTKRQPQIPVYVPPQKPIEKAGEVYVKKIPEHVKSTTKYDDDDGHYIIQTNTDFTQRYHISKLLGQGTFGKVVAAYDKVSKQECAIKIIRSVQKYREASRIELRVLSTLSKYDKNNINKCIHLRECFDYRNHICIVTDLLGMSIYDFMKTNDFMAFPASHVQNFALQLFKSVAFLHDLNLIHTDLKPENILLLDSNFDRIPINTTSKTRNLNVLKNTNIHLIDFGSAIFDDEYHSSVVSTRHYRAPEIILGTGWSFPCDIWSIGCILVELVIGDALFQTHDNLEHLALMEKILGKIDKTMIKKARHNDTGSKFFDSKHKLQFPSSDTKPNSKRYVQEMSTLERILNQSIKDSEEQYGIDNRFWSSFLDLLRKIFVYDPVKRITARQALSHPWFRMVVSDEGSNAIMSQ